MQRLTPFSTSARATLHTLQPSMGENGMGRVLAGYRNPPLALRVLLVALVLSVPGALAGAMIGLLLGEFLTGTAIGAAVGACGGGLMEALPSRECLRERSDVR